MRWTFVLLVAACGSTAAPDPNDPVSGSRLHLLVNEFADGTRAVASHVELFDKDRDERCTVTLWTDGVSRCTPVSYPIVYRDKDCTQAIGQAIGNDPHAAVYFLGPSTIEPAEMHVPRAVSATPPTIFKRGPGGTCREDTPAPNDRFFELGPEISRDLAETTRMEVPTDEAVSVLELTSTDGLRLPAGLFDHAHGEECFASGSPDDAMVRCVPALSSSTTTLFGDAGCTQPVYVGASPAPTVVSGSDPTTCVAFYDVGAEIATTTVFGGSPCTARTVDAGQHVFALAPRTIPQVSRTRVAAGSRLELVEEAGGRLRETALFDRQLGTTCSAASFAGDLCVPAATTALPGFTDASCTTPLLYAQVLPGCGGQAYATQNGVDYREVGDARTAFAKQGDACVEVANAHAVGDVLPAETFVAVTRTTD